MTEGARPKNRLMHAHPCNFRLHRFLDRGWGEIAFEYRWDATIDADGDSGDNSLYLAHCHLYEVACYSGSAGRTIEGWFCPPDPPFVGWKFRDPTDGRSGPVGMECFPASRGYAWDRHKLPGRMVLPRSGPMEYLIVATQSYRFFCDVCGIDAIVPGPHAGPHEIGRAFRPVEGTGGAEAPVWRYTTSKHGRVAWMELNPHGFVADSVGLEYGPFWTAGSSERAE